ncbi:hypothetical protein K4R64_01250 [Staphylococcus epidermidis]|nr:hypothetical protein [Staphylococcus epidermidis]
MAILISIFSLVISIITLVWNYNRNKFKITVKVISTYIEKDCGYIINAHIENNSANPINIGSISANDIYSIEKKVYLPSEIKFTKASKSMSTFPIDINPYQAKKVYIYIPYKNANTENLDAKNLTLKTYTTRGVHTRNINIGFYYNSLEKLFDNK